MTKYYVLQDSSLAAARELLQLGGVYANIDLRRAYKKLARQCMYLLVTYPRVHAYLCITKHVSIIFQCLSDHPDKNPHGREMFERIRVSYELLSAVESNSVRSDQRNVILLIKTQCIVYRRFPEHVADQKYPVKYIPPHICKNMFPLYWSAVINE